MTTVAATLSAKIDQECEQRIDETPMMTRCFSMMRRAAHGTCRDERRPCIARQITKKCHWLGNEYGVERGHMVERVHLVERV